MDFLVPGRGGSLALVECKASRTVHPDMADPMRRLAGTARGKGATKRRVSMTIVHRSPRNGTPTEAVAPGVRAIPWEKFVEGL